MPNETKTDEVVGILHQRIMEGAYSMGQRLPGERELAEELQVSRPTIRNALARLQSKNAVDVVPHKGAFVRWQGQRVQIGPSVPPHLKKKQGAALREALVAAQATLFVRQLEPDSVVRPAPEIAKQKNLDANADYFRVYNLYLVNGVPYRIFESYLSTSMDDLATEYDPSDPLQGIEKMLKSVHPDAFERVQCRMPQEQEATLLKLSRNQPIFEIERWMFLRESFVAEYTRIIANAAFHELTYTYSPTYTNWDDYALKRRMGA